MNQEKNKNINALFIGVFLIIIIITVFFVRSYYSKKAQTDAIDKANNELSGALKNAAKISVGDLAKKINSHEALSIIDVREQADYAAEHLFDSTNIPASEIKSSAGILEKNKSYIVINIDSSPDAMAYVLKSFADMGFKNISYLEGGFSAWKEDFQPTISAGDPKSAVDQSKVNYINSDKLKEIMEKEKNIFIIDVRKNAQYKDSHLKNAINIFSEDIENRKNEIPAIGKKIILCDDDGLSAFQSAVRLFDMGFFNVYSLSDGLNTWKSKGFEIVR